MKKKYYSEIKFIPFILPFFIYSLLCVGSAWYLGNISTMVFYFPMVLFFAFLTIRTHIIKEEMLIIKSGFILGRTKIEIKNIKLIRTKKRKFSFLSDRIEIFDNSYYEITLIAPKDIQGFANDLLSINPDIEMLI